jgi:hypothetical protein
MTIELNENELKETKEENTSMPKKQSLRHWFGWQVGVIGLLVLVIAGLIALFSGPQVGSVFSAVSKGIGGPVSQSSNSSNGSQSSSSAPGQAQPWDRKIIRNATVSITVNDVEQTLAQLRGLALEQNGLVFQENTTQQGLTPTGQLILQVPSQSFEGTITRIRQMAVKVTGQTTSAQDVTEEYVDLGSEIANLQRTEAGLQKLIDKAQKLEDVLALEKELGNVRGEIEKRQGRLNFLDKRTAMSNITVNVAPVPAVEPAPKAEGWQPAKVADEAWSASLNFLGKAANVLIRVVIFLWWLLPLLLIGLVWWRVRRLAVRRAESKPAFK